MNMLLLLALLIQDPPKTTLTVEIDVTTQ